MLHKFLLQMRERECSTYTVLWPKKNNFGKKNWCGVAVVICRKLSSIKICPTSPLTLLCSTYPKKEKNNFGRIIQKRSAEAIFSLLFPPVFFIFFVKSKHYHAYIYYHIGMSFQIVNLNETQYCK